MVLEASRLARYSESFVIYGEYCGGPHGDVRDQPVQGIVQYALNNELYMFDVRADSAYVGFNTAMQLLKQRRFSYISETRHRGIVPNA